MRENTCLSHPSAPLVWTEKCDVYFIYIRPTEEDDKRRWLGIMSLFPSKQSLCHSHPVPVESKLPQVLVTDMKKTLCDDPTHTANDLSKGLGLGYNPMAASLAAANKTTFSNLVNRIKNDCGRNGQNIVMNFNKQMKAKIDEREEKNMEDRDIIEKVSNLTTPYVRCVFYFEKYLNFVT